MSERPWGDPTAPEATNILVLADHQMLRRKFTQPALEYAAVEADRLARTWADILVVGGDIEHKSGNDSTAGTPAEQRAYAIAWVKARMAAADIPSIVVAGNHDLDGFTDATRDPITSQQWAARWGFPSGNKVIDLPNVRVIGLSPWTWPLINTVDGWGKAKYRDEDVAWADNLIAATNKPVYLVTHAPPPQQGTTEMDDSNNVTATFGAHANFAGWISGHMHPDVGSTKWMCKRGAMGANASVAMVCAPACGGQRAGTGSMTYEDERFTSPFHATLVSVLPDGKAEVRFRNLLYNRWDLWLGTTKVTTV